MVCLLKLCWLAFLAVAVMKAGLVADFVDVWPVASGVLTELATQIVISVPGWTVRRLRGSPEGAALRAVVAESVTRAFLDAAGDAAGDDASLDRRRADVDAGVHPSGLRAAAGGAE